MSNKAGGGREKAPVIEEGEGEGGGGGGVVKAKPDAGGGPMDRAISVNLVLARFVHVAW